MIKFSQQPCWIGAKIQMYFEVILWNGTPGDLSLIVHELNLLSQNAFYQRFWLLTTSIVSCGTGNKPSSVGVWYPNCWPIQLQKALPFTIAKSPKPEGGKKDTILLFYVKYAETPEVGGQGGGHVRPPPVLGYQLTLFGPRGADYAHHITTCPPIFSDYAASLTMNGIFCQFSHN